jgi:serine/threonine protein kinase
MDFCPFSESKFYKVFPYCKTDFVLLNVILLCDHGRYSYPIDWWGLGCLMTYTSTGGTNICSGNNDFEAARLWDILTQAVLLIVLTKREHSDSHSVT